MPLDVRRDEVFGPRGRGAEDSKAAALLSPMIYLRYVYLVGSEHGACGPC